MLNSVEDVESVEVGEVNADGIEEKISKGPHPVGVWKARPGRIEERDVMVG